MTNQLGDRVQASFSLENRDRLDGSKRSHLELNPNQQEAIAGAPPSAALDRSGIQSVRRKHLIGWLTSGMLSVAGIAAAGMWFTTAVEQIPQTVQPSGSGSPTEATSRSEAIAGLAMQQMLLSIALVMAANTGVMVLLYRAIAKPVQQLQRETQMYALGAHQIRADITTADEIGQIAQAFNQLADDTTMAKTMLSDAKTAMSAQAQQRELEVEQTRLIGQVAGFRVRTKQDLTEVFEYAIQGARKLLHADRVVIYRFYPNWSGYISDESVAPGLPVALADQIEDACISKSLIDAYLQGRVVATNDVFNAGFHPEHLQLMTKLQIKANLVTPIVKDDQLYGLLIAHHCHAPHEWNPNEIDFLKVLALQLGLSLDRVTFLAQKDAETERAQQLYQISSRIRAANNNQEIYNSTLRSIRGTLQTDRAIVYLFDQQWKGTIVAESVGHQYPTALGTMIADPCFADKFVERYQQGRVQALEDIDNAGLTDCHLAQLKPFKVRANLVAPILVNNTLHGLLVTHQCSRTRFWQEPEITFFKEVAVQMGLALDRLQVLNQLERSRQQAENLADDQRQQQDSLKRQLVQLVEQVEGAASGDLTVRADVTAGEIGTVGDFFNAIVESLRQIVMQVKESATEVNSALSENEFTIQQLTGEAQRQSEDIAQTLTSVDHMTASLQTVAESAQQAASFTRSAATTAEASQVAIDFTVQSILELRETMSETAQKMKRLGESSQSISKVISLINQIAMKTNMLALNAGIEAARAGESGLGFAVVAEEVGELATQSTSATQEIEKLVDDIQQETRQVIEAMEQSTAQIVEGTRFVKDAKKNMGHLRQLSQQTDQLVQSISEETLAQTKVSQAVAVLMQDLNEISQRTAQSSQQITDSLQKTVGIAKTLQTSMSTFTVEN